MHTARLILLGAGVGLVSFGTAAAGPIAFVALAAPQIAKRLAGAPAPTPLASGLTGSLIVLSADLIARQLLPDEVEEVLTMQGPEGALSAYGVDAFVGRLERRRKLIRQVVAVAGTEFLDLLEQLVGLLYEKIQPSR